MRAHVIAALLIAALLAGGPAVFARQWLSLPRVHQQHVIFDRARERYVRRVGNARPRHVVVAGRQDVAHSLTVDDRLGAGHAQVDGAGVGVGRGLS